MDGGRSKALAAGFLSLRALRVIFKCFFTLDPMAQTLAARSFELNLVFYNYTYVDRLGFLFVTCPQNKRPTFWVP